MKELKLGERLIVAADFKPPENIDLVETWVESNVLALANFLEGTGVILKVNSALRTCGYGLITKIQERGLGVFADLKLFDIGATMETDGQFLARYQPELLTTVCLTGDEAMKKLNATLPKTEVLGVTVLTSHTEELARLMFRYGVKESARLFAGIAVDSRIGGLISSAAEASLLREYLDSRGASNMTINTPGIRPEWAIVEGDDQNPDRIMTPFKAIKAGSDRIVIGRPIIQAKNPKEAVKRTLGEIEDALS